MNRFIDFLRDRLVDFSLNHPKVVVGLAIALTIAAATQLPRIQIDTDPEHMLREGEPARIIHHEIKERFNIYDFLVIGLVREDGAFRPSTLQRVHGLAAHLRRLDGVVGEDLLSPSDVDVIVSEAGGSIRVERLMEEPPVDAEGARRIHETLLDNAILRGKLGSDDGKALALYVPLRSKEDAEEIGASALEWLAAHPGDEEVHVAGLPVAEDTFGSAMFKQMAISAPMAFVVIFLLMLFFFRRPQIVAAPMIVAVMTVIWTMGLLVGMGFKVHIMSSMIPIFLMPIAVLDSVHILSEVHDHYRKHDSMRSTVRHVLHDLFTPMTLTSLTTFVGFIALIATPIPPVQVFGAFVALGVFFAWILSLTFNPAFAILLPEKALINFGAAHEGPGAPASHLQRFMTGAKRFHTPILGFAVIILVFSGIGVSKIRVNDNPVHWFKSNHPLRIAEQRLGDHLAGTYMAYLELKSDETDAFLDPELLVWTEALQAHLQGHGNVGGVSSVADIVKKIRWELSDGIEGSDEIPDSQEAVAQLLFLYEIGGGDPEDLFRLITPEYDAANLWVQMKEGENRQVSDVMQRTEAWIQANPAPADIVAHWGGLSAINVVWQDRMVAGMGKALGGSFITVLIMMMLLFRSVRLGIIAMLPLTLTIAMTYGFIGWIGRDYDMPTAVLSSLSLGLSIDFAIHFLQRSREIQRRTGNLRQTMAEFFGSPAQALARNIVVIALGFTPMFFAPLVPYVTVGAFFFAIMWISGATTLILLPAILSITPERVLAGRNFERTPTMKTSAALALLLAAGLAFSTLQARAQESMSAEQIAAKAHLNMYYAAEDGIAQVDMQITDKRGKSRERRFSMLRKDIEDGGEQRYFVYFQRPRDVQRTTFMVWKDPSADDARWIYIPALDLVKPISANDKRSSFVGSDFSYEDVSGRHWSEDEHELLREDVLDGHPVYVIQSTPKSDDGFATKLSFVDRERMLPLREEYRDDKGELIKLFEAVEIKDIDGILTITKRRMSTPPKGSATEITFESIRYDVGIDADLFGERTLKNPPRDLIES
jgi:hypothetical protein